MNDATRREIEKVAWQTLRDAGLTEPPVSLNALLEHLELYREFYDLQNPSFLDKSKHKIRVHGRKLVQILKKINLRAVLFHDENRIVVDETLPDLKREWPSFHEASHKILVWHKPYFCYGDTAQTLDPDWHEELEAEANFGASSLMFCGPVFTREARDTKPEWSVVKEFKKRYRKSFSTTLRRYVEFGPEVPMVMLTSTPAWANQPSDQETRCRHFVPSNSFAQKFSGITPEGLRKVLDANAMPRRGGLVADFTLYLNDDAGTKHEFRPDLTDGTYELVWQWRFADHMIQDMDENAPNFGVIARHPERIDCHFPSNYAPLNMLRQHLNAIDYHPELDQVLLSSFIYDEIWVIDHSTTSEQARGSAGGRRGKGGDLLFRYGNPAVYDAGTEEDRIFLKQHDANWVDVGLPGAGNILVMNNNTEIKTGVLGNRNRTQGAAAALAQGQLKGISNVHEIRPVMDQQGNYVLGETRIFCVEEVWFWEDPSFFAPFQGGARRLPNGNSLLSNTVHRTVLEVNPGGKVVVLYLGPAPTFKSFKFSRDRVADLLGEKEGGEMGARSCCSVRTGFAAGSAGPSGIPLIASNVR